MKQHIYLQGFFDFFSILCFNNINSLKVYSVQFIGHCLFFIQTSHVIYIYIIRKIFFKTFYKTFERSLFFRYIFFHLGVIQSFKFLYTKLFFDFVFLFVRRTPSTNRLNWMAKRKKVAIIQFMINLVFCKLLNWLWLLVYWRFFRTRKQIYKLYDLIKFNILVLCQKCKTSDRSIVKIFIL